MEKLTMIITIRFNDLSLSLSVRCLCGVSVCEYERMNELIAACVQVETRLESDMEAAYLDGDNTGMTATDTQKNSVYYVVKHDKPETAMGLALGVAKLMLDRYARVSGVRVRVIERPWVRADGHRHGFVLQEGDGDREAVVVKRRSSVSASAGVIGMTVLKSTQSGYEGFLRDDLTLLPDTRERVLASSVTARFDIANPTYLDRYDAIVTGAIAAMKERFFGDEVKGVYSPSVQFTLHKMASAVLDRVPETSAVTMSMPNIHFLPMHNERIGISFDDDVYVATSEPHGTIEASVVRRRNPPPTSATLPLARL